MKEKLISMNQLSFRAEIQRTQLRNYCNNKIQKLDIDILNSLCYVLDYDLLEYVPYEEKHSFTAFFIEIIYTYYRVIAVSAFLTLIPLFNINQYFFLLIITYFSASALPLETDCFYSIFPI